MKKLIFTILIFMLAASNVSAGSLFDAVSTSNWSTKDHVVKYKLDTRGSDVRVYEWIPADNKYVRCVFVAGEKSSGVACYEIRK